MAVNPGLGRVSLCVAMVVAAALVYRFARLGFDDRAARLLVLDNTAIDALIPGLDQARTVGLVTLPGAFIGVLLTSGSALQAGAVQILVLIGLMLSQACAVAVTIELLARTHVHHRRR